MKNNREILIELIRGLGDIDGITKEEKKKILNILENNSKSVFDNKAWEIITQVFIKEGVSDVFNFLKDLDFS